MEDIVLEDTIIDGLVYPITPKSFGYLVNSGYSRYAYTNNNPDSFTDKQNIRVYNHTTKEHFYLEAVWPELGDNNLLFVDFPRSDGPTSSWSNHVTQHAVIRTWGQSRGAQAGDFVRFTIESMDKDNYCRVNDGYNEHHSGSYSRGCFYKVVKIFKI
jgi:hypothetical protein